MLPSQLFNIPSGPQRFREWEVSSELPNMYVPAAFGSDPPAPGTQESTDEMLRAFTARFPDLMRVTNAEVLPQARTQLDAAKIISPEYNKLQLDLYGQSAPKLAELGSQVERINRTGAAQTDLDILRGSGKDLVTEAQALDRQLNPEFYKTRETASKGLEDLLGSINLGAPNVEAERLVNQENARTGNASAPANATNTVSNALSFGGELQKRRDALGQALTAATNFMQPSQGQFNPVQTALNRPSTNAGANQFQGVRDPSDQAYQTGQGFMNNVTTLQAQKNDINANRRDGLDRFNETLTGIGSIVSI